MTEILSTPTSFIGSTKRIVPMLKPSRHGWAKAGRVSLVILLLLLAWIGVTLWYAVIVCVPILWIVWPIYTLNRRHRIHREELLSATRHGV